MARLGPTALTRKCSRSRSAPWRTISMSSLALSKHLGPWSSTTDATRLLSWVEAQHCQSTLLTLLCPIFGGPRVSKVEVFVSYWNTRQYYIVLFSNHVDHFLDCLGDRMCEAGGDSPERVAQFYMILFPTILCCELLASSNSPCKRAARSVPTDTHPNSESPSGNRGEQWRPLRGRPAARL